MASNFYQTNNEVLKWDPNDEKDFLLIRFNHWISKKENFQRTKNTLDRGLFELSYSVIERDFNISNKQARNLVKRFIDLGIIELIEKGNSKNSKSIFAYTSVYYEDKKGIVEGIDKGIVNPVNSNVYKGSKGLVRGIVEGNSKKEKEKENKNVTCISSYTEKVLVKARYRGLEVKANRFNGKCKRFEGNEYIEQNGYTYEIFESEVNRVNNHWRYRQPVLLLGEGENGEDIYESRQPFKEIKVIDENKKTTTDVEVMKRRGYPQACIIK